MWTPTYRSIGRMWRVGTRTGGHRGHGVLAALAMLALVAGGCEPAPSSGPAPATPSPIPSPSPTDAPRRVATPTPPRGAGAFSCTERITIPDIADVIGAAWSPDGRTLAIDRVDRKSTRLNSSHANRSYAVF